MGWKKIILEGGIKQYLHFGYDAVITGTKFSLTKSCLTIDGSVNGKGYRMISDGSVTGISFQCDVTRRDDSGSNIEVYLKKDGSTSGMESATINMDISGTGDVGYQNTISGDFSEGNAINAFVKVTGGPDLIDQLRIENLAVLVEISI